MRYQIINRQTGGKARPTMNSVIVIILAIVGGIAVTVQGQFMGSMTQIMGAKESMFVTYVSGGIVIALLTLATGANHFGSWQQGRGSPLQPGYWVWSSSAQSDTWFRGWGWRPGSH